MNRKELVTQIKQKKSYLCVGLDTEFSKIPKHLKSDPDSIFQFNKKIIDATKDFCVAYKLNTAFYESQGIAGWEALEETVNYIPSSHFKIADAKRGDIGNTSSQYAKAFFETLQFDAVTVAPYMGEDSIRPFLEYKDKWTIVLALTSNPGARDFELLISDNETIYEKVIRTCAKFGNTDNLMFVVGANRSEEFEKIRTWVPDHFFLVPGVGAQGGSLKDISEKAMNSDCGLLVNASRAIIFASQNEDFAEVAKSVAEEYQKEMQNYLL